MHFAIRSGLLVLGLGFIAIGVWSRMRRRARVYCPGPSRSWLARLLPMAWFVRRGCGYNLVGTMPAEGGAVRCAECGTLHRNLRRLRRSPRRWRPMCIGVTLLLAAAVTHVLFPLRLGKLMRQAPTSTLILAETHFHSSLPIDVLIEIRKRYWREEMSEGEIRRLIPLLVDALRDDDKKLNADVALDVLRTFVQRGNPDAMAALNDAIESSDWQQRQMAAYVLRQAVGAAPTEELLRVSLQSLRDDCMPFGYDGNGKRSRTLLRNGWDSVHFLTQHAIQARPLIVEGMQSDDWQQRQLCAIIVTRARVQDLYPDAMSILIDALRDNDIAEDAWRSQWALIDAGPDALPWLEPFRQSDDAQQRDRVERIICKIWKDPDREGPTWAADFP